MVHIVVLNKLILLTGVPKLICLPSRVMMGYTPYRLVMSMWSRAIGGNETFLDYLWHSQLLENFLVTFIALLLLTFFRIDPHYRPQQSSPESRATGNYQLCTYAGT